MQCAHHAETSAAGEERDIAFAKAHGSIDKFEEAVADTDEVTVGQEAADHKPLATIVSYQVVAATTEKSTVDLTAEDTQAVGRAKNNALCLQICYIAVVGEQMLH